MKENKVIGKLSKHKKGFGFVTPLDVLEELRNPKDNIGKDIFIGRDGIAGAMNGDIVEVTFETAKYLQSRQEAKITRIVEHAVKEVVGTFHQSKKFGFIVPEGKGIGEDVFVLAENFGGAKNGDKVLATIITYPTPGVSAEGRITEIIAREGEPGGDIRALARAKGMKYSFPDEVIEQAKQIQKTANEIGIFSEKAKSGDVYLASRKDLRNKKIFTIDGADSKDFDDAVSIERLPNGNYLLGVHIADVSQYVIEGSPLDDEALNRGTSVYLINQVIPMLPVELSNDICSLNPGVDRLTLSVDMEIEPNGDIIDHEIYESVICSCERMVYDDVSDIIEGSKGLDTVDPKKFTTLKARYADIYEDILMMAELAEALRIKKDKRGSLDFNVGEAYIKLDETGFAYEVETVNRRVSNRMIEEFMLSANETVAEHFYWMDAPFVYRIHEKPSTEKMQEFRQFLRSFGIPLKGNSDNIHPLTLAGILRGVQGSNREAIVGTVMLRSMQKAFYGTECEGHYGLSLKYYCHFTSPIRRYPDLMIHRIIKEYLHQQPSNERISKLRKDVQIAADSSSASERKAMELEREVDKLKKCEYMTAHVGEVLEGVISGVSSFGMFVEFPNTVEGMIKLETLTDDYYDCELDKYRIIGRSTGRIFTLGQPVTVIVEDVDLEPREIDLRLASADEIEIGMHGETHQRVKESFSSRYKGKSQGKVGGHKKSAKSYSEGKSGPRSYGESKAKHKSKKKAKSKGKAKHR